MKKLVILGPTGVGKSKIAVELASALKGEIVSADSMQIYLHMDVGTAKPSPKDLKKIPHHLLSFVSPLKNFSVQEYVEEARKIIEKIENQGKQIIITGGTGLYLKAIIQGIVPEKNIQKDVEFRKILEIRLQKEGIQPLREELKKVDPEKYLQLEKNDHRRILRALAFFYANHFPISSLQTNWGKPPSTEFLLLGIRMERKKMYELINQRVDQMINNGWIDEVKELLQMKVPPNATCWQAIGYGHLKQFLEGKMTEEVTLEKIKRDTRRYAKRQLTWFKKVDNVNWFDAESRDLIDSILQFLRYSTHGEPS